MSWGRHRLDVPFLPCYGFLPYLQLVCIPYSIFNEQQSIECTSNNSYVFALPVSFLLRSGQEDQCASLNIVSLHADPHHRTPVFTCPTSTLFSRGALAYDKARQLFEVRPVAKLLPSLYVALTSEKHKHGGCEQQRIACEVEGHMKKK
jgi:hypothetical protein